VRSYRQYCSLARALDVVGDRWTLLIVRELLLRGACRYTDLRDGLPGIATNLLADRLRELEQAGIVLREVAPPPIAATLFRLTARGEELEPALHALARWGVPLMVDDDAHDVFRGHWLTFPVGLYLADRTPDRPPITIELRMGDQTTHLETRDGAVHVRRGSAERPDAVLAGTPRLVLGVLTGALELADAQALGVRCHGDETALRRLQPPATDGRPAAPT
jgi:DNA-binding HxlR family transcriptional regulator